MIYEPSYIYPNVLNAQGEQCFYTLGTNTFKILVNSDYPITSVSYTISNPDGSWTKTGSLSELNFYTNTIDGETNILEIDNVSLQSSSNKITIASGTEIDADVFSDTIWTYTLTFTDSQNNSYTTKKYAFYITPSADFVSMSSNPSGATLNKRSASFTGQIIYPTQPISWIQWDIRTDSLEGHVIYTTNKIYRSVPLDFYFDGFDSDTSYFVSFTVGDMRGNVSSTYKQIDVSYDYTETGTAVVATLKKDSSVVIDWSSMQGIEGTPHGIVIEDGGQYYHTNVPVEGHTSLRLPEGSITFKGTNDVDLHISETDDFYWSGKLYGNTPDIIKAKREDGNYMSLSFEGYVAGLYPSNNLYPSDTLFPRPTIKGRFVLTNADGQTYYWEAWQGNLEITNSWFNVWFNADMITVYHREWREA